MFAFRKKEKSELQEAIDAVLNEMKTFGPDSPEYPKLLKTLKVLCKMKADEGRRPVSKDVVWTVLGNIGCVLAIVAYEQRHVMTTKAMTFIARLGGRQTF